MTIQEWEKKYQEETIALGRAISYFLFKKNFLLNNDEIKELKKPLLIFKKNAELCPDKNRFKKILEACENVLNAYKKKEQS